MARTEPGSSESPLGLSIIHLRGREGLVVLIAYLSPDTLNESRYCREKFYNVNVENRRSETN